MVKFSKIINIALINGMEYRLNFLFELLSRFFPVIIQIYMWSAIFSNSPNKIIMNYTYEQMIQYTVISIFVSALLAVNIHWGIAQDIKTGALSKYIILPINYMAYKIFQFLGGKIMEIIIVAFGMCAVISFFKTISANDTDVKRIAFFLIVICLAMALQFLLYYCIAGIAFWIGDCGGIFTVVNVISMIVSGAVFPLDIFGTIIVRVSRVFPFYYITYLPTNLIIGKTTMSELMQAVNIMIIWIVLLGILVKIVCNCGLKKYIAAGG